MTLPPVIDRVHCYVLHNRDLFSWYHATGHTHAHNHPVRLLPHFPVLHTLRRATPRTLMSHVTGPNLVEKGVGGRKPFTRVMMQCGEMDAALRKDIYAMSHIWWRANYLLCRTVMIAALKPETKHYDRFTGYMFCLAHLGVPKWKLRSAANMQSPLHIRTLGNRSFRITWEPVRTQEIHQIYC